MLKELLEYVVGLSLAGQRPIIEKNLIPNRNAVAVWNEEEGQFYFLDDLPAPRKHVVTTLGSLAEAVGLYHYATATAWVGLQHIFVLLDDIGEGQLRKNQIAVEVFCSPIFQQLSDLDDESEFSQKSFVDLIRRNLKPSVITPDLDFAVMNLKWESHQTTEGSFAVQKSTMGKTISSEVKGEQAIPLEVTVGFCPFPSLDFSSSVKVDCSIRVDSAEQTISMKPLPGSVEMAKAAAVDQLREHVRTLIGDKVNGVFAGTP